MSLSRLYVYTVAHGLDAIDEHLNTLESPDITPDIVALEQTGSEDGVSDGVRETLIQSPATGIAWYFVVRENQQKYRSLENTAGRADSEFEAGRRFASSRGVPVVSVDLTRAESAAIYATWPRRIRDGITVLRGALVPAILASLVVVFLLGGLGLILQEGLTTTSVSSVLVSVVLFVLLSYQGPEELAKAISKVGWQYLEGIREIRDKEMYERVKDACRREDAETALLVVGANHYSGIHSLAEDDGVECRNIESPTIAQYEGDIKNISPQDFSDLTDEE